MRVPQSLVRLIDTHFSTAAIWLRFVKHKIEGNRELVIARRYMRAGTQVLDVGARKGIYTWVMSRQVGASGRVLAFEPNPGNAATLRGVFGDHKNVSIEEIALSDRAGVGVLSVPVEAGVPQDSLGHLGDGAVASGSLSYDIPLKTLDDVLVGVDRPVSFVKIDVEGHELSVLRGARATIQRHRPVFLIEIEQRHAAEPIQSRFEFLQSFDYSAWFLGVDGELASLRLFDLETHQLGPFRAGQPFVNMFLFVPSERAQS